MTLDQCTVQARQMIAMDLAEGAAVLQRRATEASEEGFTEAANKMLEALDVLYVLRRMLKTGAAEKPALSKPEPRPVVNDRAAIWPLVIADMRERNDVGTAKYGTPLQAFNGRLALIDAYQEALDLVVYLRQEIEEQRAVALLDTGAGNGLA